MIFSVFDYTCAMIRNDQILYLQQVKDDRPRNPPTVFRVRALLNGKTARKSHSRLVRVGRVRAVYKWALKTHYICQTSVTSLYVCEPTSAICICSENGVSRPSMGDKSSRSWYVSRLATQTSEM